MSIRYVPTHAITATGRRVSFDFLKNACKEALHRRVWALKDFADMNLWITSYETGGALPGATLFLSPYSGHLVKFTQVLEDLIIASDCWAHNEQQYIDWADGLIRASEVLEWMDDLDNNPADQILGWMEDVKENLLIEDPEDHELVMECLQEDLGIEF